MLKKLILLSIALCVLRQCYAMPEGLLCLKNECEENYWKTFLAQPSARSLHLCLCYTSGLGSRKACRNRKFSQSKHYDAQYQLFLIGWAYTVWCSVSGGDDELMYAIKSAFYSFRSQMFAETLTDEEYTYFIETAKSFFAKYYSLRPKESSDELELDF